jgi:hypothetical protein
MTVNPRMTDSSFSQPHEDNSSYSNQNRQQHRLHKINKQLLDKKVAHVTDLFHESSTEFNFLSKCGEKPLSPRVSWIVASAQKEKH